MDKSASLRQIGDSFCRGHSSSHALAASLFMVNTPPPPFWGHSVSHSPEANQQVCLAAGDQKGFDNPSSALLPFLGGRVLLLKQTTQKGYHYSNLSTGGPSLHDPIGGVRLQQRRGVLHAEGPLARSWSPKPPKGKIATGPVVLRLFRGYQSRTGVAFPLNLPLEE